MQWALALVIMIADYTWKRKGIQHTWMGWCCRLAFGLAGYALALAALLLPLARPAAAQQESTVELEGDYFRYERDPDIFKVTGHVVAKSKEFQITAEELTIDQKRHLAIAQSPFTLRLFGADPTKDQVISGEKLVYNTETKKAVIDNGFMDVPADNPDQIMFIHADRIISFNRSKYLVSHAHMTSCYYQELGKTPHYETEVGYIEYVPGDRIVAWSSSLYLNKLFLLWVPVWFINLRDRGQGVDLGNNQIEGNFLKTRFPYRITDQHRGFIYNNLLEKKGYGLGFQHSWQPSGSSYSSAAFYGLPIDNFADRQWRLFHDQRFSQNTGVTLDYQDTNIYSFSTFLAPRDTNTRFAGKLEDSRTFTLFGESDLTSRWSIGTTVLSQKNVSLQGVLGSVTDQTNSNFSWDVNVEKTSFNFNSAWNINTQRNLAQTPGGRDNLTVSESWNNNLTFNQELAPSLTMTSNIRQFTNSSKNNQVVQPGTTIQQFNQRSLQATTTLSQDLKFATLGVNIDKSFDLSRGYNLANPTDRQAFRQRGTRDVLPELTLQSQTIWEQGIPFTLSGQFGHFFESSTLTDTTRTLLRWSMGGKDYSLENLEGWQDIPILGTARLNFSGSRAEQYFYGTQDEQYFLNGEANLQLGFDEALANFHFTRGVTNIRNNSPFQFDRLSLSKTKTFTGRVDFGNIPECTLHFDSGFDYTNQSYFPLNVNLRSDVGKYFSFNLQDSYSFRRDKPGEMNRLHINEGNWAPFQVTMGINSSEQPYGGLYGAENMSWGWQINTQLSYNWQQAQWQTLLNRLYISTGGNWVTHWELVIQAGYDTRDRVYRVNQIYVNKDLHDFVMSFSFDRFLNQFLFQLQMVAFPTVSTNSAQSTLNQALSGSPLGR